MASSGRGADFSLDLFPFSTLFLLEFPLMALVSLALGLSGALVSLTLASFAALVSLAGLPFLDLLDFALSPVGTSGAGGGISSANFTLGPSVEGESGFGSVSPVLVSSASGVDVSSPASVISGVGSSTDGLSAEEASSCIYSAF